jgi:hypothetical protein
MNFCKNKMKNRMLEIRVSEYQMKQLSQEAKRRGVTKSELIHSFIAKLPEPV